MKYLSIVFIFCLGLMSTQANAQGDAISKYFEKYMDDDRFTMVYVSPRLFRMFSKVDVDMDQDLKQVISDLEGLRILTTDFNGQELYKEAIKKINTTEYETLMVIRDEGDDIQFLIKETDEYIEELLLLVGGDDFTLMSFRGKIDLEKISKLSESMDIDGLEHLEKVDDQ